MQFTLWQIEMEQTAIRLTLKQRLACCKVSWAVLEICRSSNATLFLYVALHLKLALFALKMNCDK
jgi:hypothetical protein